MERWEELIRQASEDEVKDFLVELVKISPSLADSVVMEFCAEEDLDNELINKIFTNYRKLYDRYYENRSNATQDQARAYTQRLDVFIITEVQPLISKGLIDGAFKVAKEIYETNSKTIPVATSFGHGDIVQDLIQKLMIDILNNSNKEQRAKVYEYLLEQKTVDDSVFRPIMVESILDQFLEDKI